MLGFIKSILKANYTERTFPLWKSTVKGNTKDPFSYRGLQVGSTLYKLTITIIIDRLKTGMMNNH